VAQLRGGQAQPIRVVDLRTLELTKLPWDGSVDRSPAWLGDTIFFLSDRDFATNAGRTTPPRAN